MTDTDQFIQRLNAGTAAVRHRTEQMRRETVQLQVQAVELRQGNERLSEENQRMASRWGQYHRARAQQFPPRTRGGDPWFLMRV